jgi:mono/diheme cytochrome c family protein
MKLILVGVACMLPLLCAAAVEQAQSSPKPQAQTQTQAAPAAPAVIPGANLVNPVKPTAASLAEAKQHYSWDCAMCHGDTGKGNGSLAASEHMTVPDFTNPATLASLKDGQIYTIIRKGSVKMPPEDKARANDATVWNLVNYLRSMSEPGTRATK